MRRLLFACAAVVLGLAFTTSAQASPARGHAGGSHASRSTHVDVPRGHTFIQRGHQDIHRSGHQSGYRVNPLYPPLGGRTMSPTCGYRTPIHMHTVACYGLR